MKIHLLGTDRVEASFRVRQRLPDGSLRQFSRQQSLRPKQFGRIRLEAVARADGTTLAVLQLGSVAVRPDMNPEIELTLSDAQIAEVKAALAQR